MAEDNRIRCACGELPTMAEEDIGSIFQRCGVCGAPAGRECMPDGHSRIEPLPTLSKEEARTMSKITPERVQQLFEISAPGSIAHHAHPVTERGVTIGADELAELVRVYDEHGPEAIDDPLAALGVFTASFAGSFMGSIAGISGSPSGLLEQLRRPRAETPPAPAPAPLRIKQKPRRRRANR